MGSCQAMGSGLNTVRLANFMPHCAHRLFGVSHGTNQSGIGSRRTLKRLPERQLAGAGLPRHADRGDTRRTRLQQQTYPGSRTGQAGYPQAQCAVLVECASHAIIAANLGAYREAEWEVCKPLLTRLTAGMLCLADRGFNGYTHWATAQASGAQLLWRCSSNRKLPVVKALGDGSYLSTIYPSRIISKKQRRASTEGIAVRVIDYALPSAVDAHARYRLLTTLLDKKWGQTRYCDYTSSLSRFQCMKYHGPSSPLCDSWPATAHLLSTSKRGGVTEKGI